MSSPATYVWCLLHHSKIQKAWFSGPTYLDQLLGIAPAKIYSNNEERGHKGQQHTPATNTTPLRVTPSSGAVEGQDPPYPTYPAQRLHSAPVAEMPKRKAGEGVQKYYAVRVGVTPGIYRSWPECLAQITGFRGAICASASPPLTRRLIRCSHN